MASAGTAYVDVEAKLDEFGSQVDAAVSAIDTQQVDVEAVADTTTAQSDIDSIEGGSTETEVTADTAQAQESIDSLGSTVEATVGSLDSVVPSAGGAGGAISGFGTAAAEAAGAAGLMATGIGAVAVGLGLSLNAAMDAQVVTAQTAGLLQTTGANAYISAGQISDLATEIMGYSGFSDEAVASGENLLLMFSNVSSEAAVQSGVFEQTTKLGADLATVMGGDVTSAIRTLGRAVDDPTAGMGRLRRAGIQLTEAQQDQIRTLQESGDLQGAQAALLDIVAGKVDGLAEAYGDTLAGQTAIAKEKLDNLEEELGNAMIPALVGVLEPLSNVVSGLTSAAQATDNFLAPLAQAAELAGTGGLGGFVGDFLTGGVVGLLGQVGDSAFKVAGDLGYMKDELHGTAEGADGAASAIDELDREMQEYLDNTFAVPEAQRALRDSFTDLFGVLLTEGHSADDVAAAMEQIAFKTADLGVANGDFAGTADLTIQRLRGMRDAGQITAAQFDTIKTAIRGAQDEAPLVVPTSAPGADNATTEVKGLDTALRKIPPGTNANVYTVVQRAQFDQLIRDLDAADGRRFAMQVSVNTTGARASGGPVSKGSEYLVGEEGPEMFVPERSGTIIPAGPTAAMTGGSNTYQVTINAAPGTDNSELARMVSDELRKLERAGR